MQDTTVSHMYRCDVRDWYVMSLTGNFTGQDLAGLTILSNLPYYFFLHTFYLIDIVPVAVALSADVASIAIPFGLLKPLIHAHEPGKGPNQQVAQDWQIQGLAAAFGAAIYAIVVYSSFLSWLPLYLINHSAEAPTSIEVAHKATYLPLWAMMFPVGWATAQFLFTPPIGSRANPGLTDPKLKLRKTQFNPETATLAETIAFNLGFGADGLSKRAKILGKRTAVLVACSVINTFYRVFVTVKGTEPAGAAAWASVWALAAVLTSSAYAWVANE
jgi:hypothetical protein